MVEIDFSYKRNAVKCYYDIEVLDDLFTICMLADGYAHIVFVPSENVKHPSEFEIYKSIKDELTKTSAIKAIGENPEIKVEILKPESPDRETAFVAQVRLREILNNILQCKHSFMDTDAFVEYRGWNSSRYDLPMLILAKLLLTTNLKNTKTRRFTTKLLRKLSDIIINTDGAQWLVYKEIDSQTQGLITEHEIKVELRYAAYMDGHIDIAKIARSQDAGAETKFPPGLKREMARYGLDIVVDELVNGQGDRVLSASDCDRLVRYNINDVVGTVLVGRNKLVVASIETRDTVREMYPYTSARATPVDKISRWNPPERDCTAAELAGRVLIGEKRIKPADYSRVSYVIELPSGEHDLLEFIKSTEAYVPDDVYTFFDHFRGKDTTTARMDYLVKKSQPITHSATINIPYYRDGKPIDCFIRLSTGGAHGSVMAGLSNYTAEDVKTWTRSDVGAAAHQKPTIDIENVLHLDWASFYPTMASKMKLYETQDGIDRYTEIIHKRIDIKKELNHDRSAWTEKDYDLFNIEQGLKFVLNNATGAGNMHSKFALLPVDNKTLSMRLIGNMFIWCLAQRLAQAGAFIISTNTDGLYITGLTLDKTQEIIDGYVADYGMAVEPEIVKRFINRDTSNRIEYGESGIAVIGGRLNSGREIFYTEYMIGRSVAQPIGVTNAVLRYMDDKDWLYKPYDRQKLASIIEDIRRDSTSLEPWYHLHVGTPKRKLIVDGVVQSKINRVALTLDGKQGALSSARKLVKAQIIDIVEFFMDESMGLSGARLAKWFTEHNIEACDTSVITDDYVIVSIEKIKDGSYVPNNDLDEYVRGATTTPPSDLGLSKGSDIPKPIRVWRESDVISGYPSNRITLANTAYDVQHFDLNRLDMEAYVDWAEQLLLSWKVTADIPELGLKYFDDPACKRSVVAGQSTKRDRAIAKLVAVYETCSSD